MPTGCKLTSDFTVSDCLTLEKGGTTGGLYLINYSDWVTADVTGDSDKQITDIVLTTVGAKAVYYDLPRGTAVNPSSQFVENTGGKSGYTNTLEFFIPSKSQALKNEISGKANYGRVVAIVVLDSSIVAQVFGSGVGMKLTGFEENPNDVSKGGGMTITFSTPTDISLEDLPSRVFGTGLEADRVTTIAKLDALKTAVT